MSNVKIVLFIVQRVVVVYCILLSADVCWLADCSFSCSGTLY